MTLQVKENGQGNFVAKSVNVPYYKINYVDRVVVLDDERDERTDTVRVAVRKLAHHTVENQVYAPGVSMLLCDEISLTAVKSEASNYEFECPGRLLLRVGRLVLDAESGSYKNGELKLTGVTIIQGGTTATADNLTLPLPVWGLTTANHNRPVSTQLQLSWYHRGRSPLLSVNRVPKRMEDFAAADSAISHRGRSPLFSVNRVPKWKEYFPEDSAIEPVDSMIPQPIRHQWIRCQRLSVSSTTAQTQRSHNEDQTV